jgi:hypothetical protein
VVEVLAAMSRSREVVDELAGRVCGVPEAMR